jgi:CheY-like chemotaxis protein
MGLAEIAMTRCLPPDSPAQVYLEDILSAGNRAKKVIAQIRSLSVSGATAKTGCLLHNIIEEALHLAEATLSREITIVRKMNWKTAYVLADPTRLHQMILNLLTNAIQAIDDSPGEIAISLKKTELAAYALPHPELPAGMYAQLTIRDSGRGILPEHLGRIFEPFFSTRKAAGGTGLGLTATYGIVRQCGGAITVESEVGRGSVFSVYLPSTPPTAVDKGKRAHTPPRKKRNASILLVDDDELVTRSFRMLLEGYGYDIDAHDDPREALAAFCRNPHKYDLAVVDMVMPGMTGMELAQRLKSHGTEIKIMICTGYLLDISPAELLEAGIEKILYKPITGADMATNVERILRKSG